MSELTRLATYLERQRALTPTVKHPVVLLQPEQPNLAAKVRAIFDTFDQYAETIAKDIPLIGLEGEIDTSPLYPQDVIDPENPPRIQLIKLRHNPKIHNFHPKVKPHPKRIPPVHTPLQEISEKTKLRPEDILQLTVEIRPSYENNHRRSNVIDIKAKAWGKNPEKLMNNVFPNPYTTAHFEDPDTNREQTILSHTYDQATSTEQVADVAKPLTALTPLVFGHKRFWSEEDPQPKPASKETIDPIPTTIAGSIQLARQLKKAA